jgi:hypothetical protein
MLKEAVDQSMERTDKFADFIFKVQKLPDCDNVFRGLPQCHED